jgi:serine/threonine-protein kinase RsbW
VSVEAPVHEVVRLALPAELECVRIARLTASAVATTLGFDVEEIEDLRIAVDELSSLLVERSTPGGQLELEFTMGPETLGIVGQAPAGDSADEPVEYLTAQVLQAVIEEYELRHADGRLAFSCVARRRPE